MSAKGVPIAVDRLAGLPAEKVLRLYRETFGHDVPSGNPDYARRKIAFRVQEIHHGGLPESARQYALGVVRSSKVRRSDPRFPSERLTNQDIHPPRTTVTDIVSDTDTRLPMPGSVLVREYQGRTVLVNVLVQGFEHEGRRFHFLSAVAREVTGTRWNGFLFFGLTKDKRNDKPNT